MGGRHKYAPWSYRPSQEIRDAVERHKAATGERLADVITRALKELLKVGK